MKKVPELVFVVDVMREATAVHEANLKGIPVIALVDTNCDPSGVDYIIPSNDDAIRAIKLLVAKIADAALEGQAFHKEDGFTETMTAAELSARPVISTRRPEFEPEMADKDLLGDATLAKLGGKRDIEELVQE
jgi:small subunit ribosomal protein S2